MHVAKTPAQRAGHLDLSAKLAWPTAADVIVCVSEMVFGAVTSASTPITMPDGSR